MRDEIDHILKEKLVNGDPLTGLSGWDRLEKELIAADEKKKRRDKYLFIFQFSRYAALVLLLVGFSYLTYRYNGGVDGGAVVAGSIENTAVNAKANQTPGLAQIILPDSSIIGESSDQGVELELTENLSQDITVVARTNRSEEKSEGIAIQSGVEQTVGISTDLAARYDKEHVLLASTDQNMETGEKIPERGTGYVQGLIGESVQRPATNPEYAGFRLNNLSVPLLFPATGAGPFIAEADRLDIDLYLQEFDLLYGEEEADDKKWWISTTADVLSLNRNEYGPIFYSNLNMFEKIGWYVRSIELNDYYGNEYYEYTGGLPHDQLCSGGSGFGFYSHDLPFSAGFSVNRGISEKFGIGMGVVLKKMWSRSGYLRGSHYEQTVIYIGIPITLNYNLLPKSSNWDLKLLLGVTGDKAIFTEGKDCLSFAGVITEYPTNLKNPDEIMFSSNVGLGVGYRFVKGISLYAEPNLRYTFYSKGQPVTFFTDRLFGVVVRTGLKFEF